MDFQKININDYELYKKIWNENPFESSTYTFFNLYGYESINPNYIYKLDDFLIILSKYQGLDYFMFPLGHGDLKRAIYRMKEYMNKPFYIMDLNEKMLAQIKMTNIDLEYQINEDREMAEYIYLSEDLAYLKGKKYSSKRNHINRFSKENNYSYKKIDNNIIDSVKKTYLEWFDSMSIDDKETFECEKMAFLRGIENYDLLNLVGGVIIVNDEIVAISIGEIINDNMVAIHIEKTHQDFRSAYPVINREFVVNEFIAYKHINREEDMGLLNLRKAKKSYKPDRMLKKYNVKFK